MVLGRKSLRQAFSASGFGGAFRPWRSWAVTFISLAVWGCMTVSADENEVVIEHMAEYSGAAQYMADEHCGKFGKIAQQVQRGIQKTYSLGFRKKVSVFHCIGKAEGGVPVTGYGGGKK